MSPVHFGMGGSTEKCSIAATEKEASPVITVVDGPRSGPSCTPTPVYLLYGRRAVSAGAYLTDNELFTHNQ